MNADGKEIRVVTRKGVSIHATKKTSKVVLHLKVFDKLLADKLESAVEDRLMELKAKLEATMNEKMDKMEAKIKESIVHRMENQKKEILDAELQKKSMAKN